jgi:ABC-type glycerol-3-phosphate transport system substrate-binding protein
MAPGDAADVGVLAAHELGAWAERGDLATTPPSLRAADNPFQWLGVLALYRDRIAAWAGQGVALPVAGDGWVVVYRADRYADAPTAAVFLKKLGHPLATPASWEDIAEHAEFFRAKDGKPSLPPLPADDRRLADLFFRIAACYDRAALSEAEAGKRGGEVLSFHHDVQSGRPRIEFPAFVTAAAWLARLKDCRAVGPADPAAALADGRAVLAVLSLDELAKLPRENGAVPAKFGIAPVPGARVSDPKTGRPVPGATPNYVPYFAGGKLGVVRTRCPHQAAAFDLVAELAGPARGLELVSVTTLGAGPTRGGQLDRERISIWYGYGFDARRTEQLQDAMRWYVAQGVGNPTFGLRGPDEAALTAALAAELKRVAAGEVPPGDGLKAATAAWQKLDAAVPAEQLVRWRRRAAGLP